MGFFPSNWGIASSASAWCEYQQDEEIPIHPVDVCFLHMIESIDNRLFQTSNTKVEIDFSDHFIDNRSKGGIFGGGTGLRLSS